MQQVALVDAESPGGELHHLSRRAGVERRPGCLPTHRRGRLRRRRRSRWRRRSVRGGDAPRDARGPRGEAVGRDEARRDARRACRRSGRGIARRRASRARLALQPVMAKGASRSGFQEGPLAWRCAPTARHECSPVSHGHSVRRGERATCQTVGPHNERHRVDMCLISPCRDEAQYMRRTLDSVAAQTVPPARLGGGRRRLDRRDPGDPRGVRGRLPYLRSSAGPTADGAAWAPASSRPSTPASRRWTSTTSTTSASSTSTSTCRRATSSS